MVELVGSCVAKAEKKKRENEKMKNEGSCAIVSREQQKDVRPRDRSRRVLFSWRAGDEGGKPKSEFSEI
jgi:hypothetical protein